MNTTLDLNDGEVGDGLAADAELGLTSLRAAIQEAEATIEADTIQFGPFAAAATLEGPGQPATINLLSALPTITQPLHIDGPGYNLLTIRRSSTVIDYRIFTFESGMGEAVTWTVDGLTLADGRDFGGGAINVDGDEARLNLNDCFFQYNHSTTNGGALRNGKATVFIDDCDFAVNTAAITGGAIFNFGGTATIAQSRIYANSAQFGGGVGSTSGVTTLDCASEIFSNSASLDGGGIWANGVVNMYGGLVYGNEAGRDGGGFFFTANSQSTIRNVLIDSNHSVGIGGGMYVSDNCTITLDAVTLQNNTCTNNWEGPGIVRKASSTFTHINGCVLQSYVVLP